MKININSICGKYQEIQIVTDGTITTSGCLTEEEAMEYAIEFISAAEDLISMNPLRDTMNKVKRLEKIREELA